MSRKALVQCSGSGKSAAGIILGANPRANCPHCSKRCEVTQAGKIRKHMTYKTIKGKNHA